MVRSQWVDAGWSQLCDRKDTSGHFVIQLCEELLTKPMFCPYAIFTKPLNRWFIDMQAKITRYQEGQKARMNQSAGMSVVACSVQDTCHEPILRAKANL
jgi:hypothetical protein